MPKNFLDLKSGNERRPRKESLQQAIPSQLDEIRETMTGEERRRAERLWTCIVTSTLMELGRRNSKFDDGFVRSLHSQFRNRGSLSERQLHSLDRIVKGFFVDEEVRRQYKKGRPAIYR